MIIDSHTHLIAGDDPCYPLADSPVYSPGVTGTPAELLAEMDAAGVQRAVVISPYCYLWDNRYHMESGRAHGERLAVVVLVDPRSADGPAKLRVLADAGASGIRIHGKDLNEVELDDPVSTPLWETVADLGITVDAWAVLDEYPRLEARIEQFPEIPIILDHCGYVGLSFNPPSPNLPPVLALARYPNVYAKLTFLDALTDGSWPYEDGYAMVRRVIDAYGAERCMWGSNFPTSEFNQGATYAQHLEIFQTRLDLSAEERRWILGGTAERLWRWRQA